MAIKYAYKRQPVTLIVELVYGKHAVLRREMVHLVAGIKTFERLFPRAPCAFGAPARVRIGHPYVFAADPAHVNYLGRYT